jgi:UDP-glucose 4-epimerase
MPLEESMSPNPLSPYALQKLAAEQYTRLFHRLYGMQTLTLRYFNVFGPRMATEGAYLTVISNFLQARRAGRPLAIDGDGEQTRDFTHVRDVVRANLLADECCRRGWPRNQRWAGTKRQCQLDRGENRRSQNISSSSRR